WYSSRTTTLFNERRSGLTIRLILLFVFAFGLYAALRYLLRKQKLTVRQFFAIYLTSLVGFVLLYLSLTTGLLHPVFGFLAAAIPVIFRVVPWVLRAVGLAKMYQRFKTPGGGSAGATPDPAREGEMTESQALDILGLDATASKEDIIAAHRKMMQKIHPDRGGSTILAAQINAAKELLLKLRG
ncbi:MAG: DnaJ domain-containing protein, partial [Pseudomonadales bacterium]